MVADGFQYTRTIKVVYVQNEHGSLLIANPIVSSGLLRW